MTRRFRRRRRLLRCIGAILASGITGCTGPAPGDGDGDSGVAGSTPVEGTPRETPRATPADSTGTGTTRDATGTTPRGTTTAPGRLGMPGSCDRPTPRPIPDLRVYNRTDEPLDVTVTVTPASGGEPVYRETVAVPSSGETDRFDVFPAGETYRVVAERPDGRSGEGLVDGGRVDRYGIATVTVDSDEVLVERLGIHPGTTATPCPG